MASYFEDPRKELLDDVLQWLEWQASCGGEVWPVEDEVIWEARLPKLVSSQLNADKRSDLPGFLQKKSSPTEPKRTQTPIQSGFLPPRSVPTASVESDARQQLDTSPKAKRVLGGAFSKVLQARAPSIDFSKLDEKTGLKTIKEHQQKYCRASKDKRCAIGGGRPANPVLVLEGHTLGLTPIAKDSLGKIMDHVLKIPRTKMYWLPYPITDPNQPPKSDCTLCPHLFKASLECIAPQIVLLMGAELEQKVSMRAKPSGEQANASIGGLIEMGVELELHTNKWTVPALWTHHPSDMATDTRLKRECMEHLKVFTRMLRKVRL